MIIINPEKALEIDRATLVPLSKRQFALHLDSIKATEDPEDETTLYDLVIGLINQDKKKRIEYETVSEIERSSPTVAVISAAMGWTDEQVDEMWEYGLAL